MNNIEYPSDESLLTIISTSLRKDGKLYESIYRIPVKDLGEFYERAAKEIRWEETFGSKKPIGQKKEAESLSQNNKMNNGNNEREAQGDCSNNQVSK